jgi:DNA-directed RNA polymerase subunit RPC12/RpoP
MSREYVCAECGQLVQAKPAGKVPTLCPPCRAAARRVPFRVGICLACGEQFMPNTSMGPMPARCVPCQLARRRVQTNAAAALWRARHPEANREQCAQYKKAWIANPRNRRTKREYEILRQYGITAAQLDEMIQAQGSLCAICHREATGASGSGGRLHIDHCHETGKVRGLICGRCNRGIGLLGDDPTVLRAAAAYIEASRKDEPA